MKTLTFLALFIAFVPGCNAPRYTLLTVPAISMTQPSFTAGYQAQPGERVDVAYCRGDDPLVSKDENVGLIDEAVMKAQKQTGATYISDVTISQKDDCVTVEGTAMK
jgi:hypothetical protein